MAINIYASYNGRDPQEDIKQFGGDFPIKPPAPDPPKSPSYSQSIIKPPLPSAPVGSLLNMPTASASPFFSRMPSASSRAPGAGRTGSCIDDRAPAGLAERHARPVRRGIRFEFE